MKELGRELDVLVAEKLMGWKEEKSADSVYFVDYLGDEKIIINDFYPSEQIADAWLVVEKLREMGVRPLIIPDWNDEWQCIIYREEKFICQSDFYNDAPLAICEAALEFVDGKI